MSLWQWFLLSVLVFWCCLYLPLGFDRGWWYGGYHARDKCVRKQGGQHTFEWICTNEHGIITLTQSDNIKNCTPAF